MTVSSSREKENPLIKFGWLLNALKIHPELIAVGLVLVPQEGDGIAGLPCFSSDALWGSISSAEAKQVSTQIVKALTENTQIKKPLTVEERQYNLFPIVGNFGTPIGYIWMCCEKFSISLKNNVVQLCQQISEMVEYSKRNYFHRKLSTWVLRELEESNEFIDLANSIEKGIYCDGVYVWVKNGNKLLPKNFSGLELPVQGSIAGEALDENISKVIADLRTHPSPVLARDYFLGKGYNSGIIIPVRFYGKFEINGIVAIFFNRPNGITKIDQELCEYAVRYHELAWRHKNIETVKINKSDDKFYIDAVACLCDFHEIQFPLAGIAALEDGLIVSFGDRANEFTKILKNNLKDIGKITEKHGHVIKIAGDFQEMLDNQKDFSARRTSIIKHAKEYIQSLHSEDTLKKYKIKIKFIDELPSKTYRLEQEALELILRNVVSNSVRALKDKKNHPDKRITISFFVHQERLVIKILDNGDGISPDYIDRIFEPHFSTYEKHESPGQGLGLANVMAMMMGKYNETPTVRSVWGEWTEITTKIWLF